MIPIDSVLVAIFLMMEARRYRYYEIWSSRVRVLETGYFAQLLAPDGAMPEEAWAKHLAADPITPHFTITASGPWAGDCGVTISGSLRCWRSVGYLKVYLHPLPARDFDVFIERATVGVVPGWFVFVVGFVFNSAVAIFAIGTLRLREATGEILPQHQFSLRPLRTVRKWTQAATTGARTTVRAKRARQRVRTGTVTGEFKKVDFSEMDQVSDQKSEVRDHRSEDPRQEYGG